MGAEETLLRAWLDGSIAEEDVARFEAWLKADEANMRQLVMASAMEAQLEQLVTDRIGTDAALVEGVAVSDQLGQELIDTYLAGDLAAVEMGRLQQYLQCDIHRLRRLVLDAGFEYDLHQQVSARIESDRYEPSTDQTPIRLPTNGMPLSDKRERADAAKGLWSYAAAGVLLAAAVLLWVMAPPAADPPPASTPDAGPVVAAAPEPTQIAPTTAPTTLSAAHTGAVISGSGCTLVRDGAKLLVAGDAPLLAGDRVLVADDGLGELRLDDGSFALLTGGTVLGWAIAPDVTLELAHGTLEVAAAPQPAGAPMRIRTAGATATVVGTVFALETDGERSLLSVREGEVELADEQRTLAVVAGDSAEADAAGIRAIARESNWLGAELPGIGSGSAGMLPFVDLMRYARGWRAHYRDGTPEAERQPIAIDERGWVARLEPGQEASTVILHSGEYPAGVYTCLYDGDGLLEFGYGTNVIRTERGRLEVDVTPTPHGVLMHLVETDPEDPIRNIRLIMPGFEDRYAEDPFNPSFVDALRGVAVLRTFGWLHAGGEDWLGWDQRRLPGDGPGRSGPRESVALEEVLTLVDRLDCDLWLNAPHNADDSYFAGLAELLAERLDPERSCYLEYSSEIWNGLFRRVQWCAEQGRAAGYTQAEAIAFANDRSEALWSAVESRLGPERVVNVLTYQDVGYFRDHQQAHGRAFERAEALAIYGGIRGTLGADLGREGLVTATRDLLLGAIRAEAERQTGHLDDAVLLRARYGKRILAYSAGLMFWADGNLGIDSGDPISQYAGAIANDPAAAGLLGGWLGAWRDEVGDIAVVPLGGSPRRGMRPDTPARERWAQAPVGPTWWALHRNLRPIEPFPPAVPKASGPNAAPEF